MDTGVYKEDDELNGAAVRGMPSVTDLCLRLGLIHAICRPPPSQAICDGVSEAVDYILQNEVAMGNGK